MSDEDAFLAAITANPADDTPRLVYADWLDDRSDPRAEYVRLEVERHRLKARDPKRPDLTARLDALRLLADPHWLPRIDRVSRLTDYWTPNRSREIVEAGLIGRPLARLESVHFPSSVQPGDYVYAFAYHTKRLFLVARMRVEGVTIGPSGATVILSGTEGTAIRFNHELPSDTLDRFRWHSGDGERGFRLKAPGTLGGPSPLQSSLRLTPATAAELDRLLRDG